jgi:hypothetical protein
LKGKPPIPIEDARTVHEFFQHEWIVVRELDRATADEARELVWNERVKPKDAVHVGYGASRLQRRTARSARYLLRR